VRSISGFEPLCGAPAARSSHSATRASLVVLKGETIECPFHAFRFEPGGQCVATAYGSPPPPRARQRAYPVCERHGEILVWYGNAGEAPWFEVPEIDTVGWVEPAFVVEPLRGHPDRSPYELYPGW